MYTVIIILITALIAVCNLLPLVYRAKWVSVVNICLHLALIAVPVVAKKPLDWLFLTLLISLCSSLIVSGRRVKK